MQNKFSCAEATMEGKAAQQSLDELFKQLVEARRLIAAPSGSDFAVQFRNLVEPSRRSGPDFEEYGRAFLELEEDGIDIGLVYSVLRLGLFEAEDQQQMFADGERLAARNARATQAQRLLEEGLKLAEAVATEDWRADSAEYGAFGTQSDVEMWGLAKDHRDLAARSVKRLDIAIKGVREITLAPREGIWGGIADRIERGSGRRREGRPPKPWMNAIETLPRRTGVPNDLIRPITYPLRAARRKT